MEEVKLEVEDSVAVVTLCAASRMNSLTPEMAVELIEIVESINSEPEIGVTIIRGDGGTFCSGAHLKTLAGNATDPADDRVFRKTESIYDSFSRVEAMKTPTIAAVRGHAVGAGLNLAMATDIRIISRTARLRSGFLRIGVHPGGGHFTLTGRAGGRSVAAAMGVFGCDVTGELAVAKGLAWEAVDDGDVDARALELARNAAQDPALAREATRHLRMETGAHHLDVPSATDLERAAQMWSLRRRETTG